MQNYQSFKDFKGVPATVSWFDNLSGEGMVRLADGSCVYVHYSAFEGSHGKVWITLPGNGDNIPCEVEVFEDYQWRQVARIRCPTAIIVPRGNA